MEYKKFKIYKSPYIRKADYKCNNSSFIMGDFIIGLLPIILVGWYKNGFIVYSNTKEFKDLIHPLVFLICGCIFSYIIELLFYYFKFKTKEIFKQVDILTAIIPGLLLALILPIKCPLWLLFIGCLVSTLIGKLLFGGFGNNLFNPSLVGYVFVISAYYSVLINSNSQSDVTSTVTPLNLFKDIVSNSKNIIEVINDYGGLSNLCFGLRYGSFAETSSIACFISLVYYMVRGTIDYRITLYLLFSFVFSCFVVGIFIDINHIFEFVVFNLFTGGVIFGSIFMSTEPVTAPKSIYGKKIYALFIGLVIFLLRLLSDMPDGTSTAILFLNMFSSIIDNYGAKIIVLNKLSMKLLKLAKLCLIYFIVILYCVFNVLERSEVGNFKDIELVKVNQNYEKLKDDLIIFNYLLLIDNNQFIVEADINGNIITGLDNIDQNLKEDVSELIINNKINKRNKDIKKSNGYITKVEKNDDEYIIYCHARGYLDSVIIKLSYNQGIVKTLSVDLTKEKELAGGLENSNGSKDDLIAIGNGERSDVLSGVTYTSVSLISARKAGYDYINKVLGGINE